MKRSSLKLVLAGSLPLALGACGPSEDTYEVTQRVDYADVDACVNDQVPRADCERAYQQARLDHQHSAQRFDSEQACEAAYSPGGCEAYDATHYQPKLDGFALQTTGEVTQTQLDAANREANLQAHGSGLGSAATGVVAGMLLSRVIAPDSRRYSAQPLYRYGAGPNDLRRDVLGRRKDEQQPASSYSGYSGGGGGASASSAYREAPRRQVGTSAIMRSGFGSAAVARGGWGGKSSSFFGG
ncbi:DUF1190 domain-containing protein [Pseudomonas sp. S75]|uniref:DUF1190 domain-containing protein n=1 Tax=unclassified Pseudomonas TaxID=196821 RepID=UPI001908F3E0|nr:MULTISPECIES: DUF1190 domain-containing protein [unclassified Pseudomonas]MBJ9975223.1 DUF1190 domain-containing protein [Pseudomonas sp. S30]MBK0152803.1 DUF1190 domain-containing protein [Pseudomonas sp. S75]